MLQELLRISERIREGERRLTELARSKREEHRDRIVRVEPVELEGRIGGVDGGLGELGYHSLEIILVRAVGVVFSYSSGRLTGVSYYPSARPMPEIVENYDPLENDEIRCFRSLTRIKREIAVARQLLDHVDFLLLDGSLVPQHEDRPRRGSRVNSLYREVVEDLTRLYREAEKKGVVLVGVIKDSRGNRFTSSLGLDIPDTLFLYHFLRPGERTQSFRYSEYPRDHPVLMDFPEWADRIGVFYMKTAEYARPIRVEFLGDEDSIDSVILALSMDNRAFGFPTVLVEADLRAKIDHHELHLVRSRLDASLGNLSLVYSMRRLRKPFG